jgi:hypothetical protein
MRVVQRHQFRHAIDSLPTEIPSRAARAKRQHAALHRRMPRGKVYPIPLARRRRALPRYALVVGRCRRRALGGRAALCCCGKHHRLREAGQKVTSAAIAENWDDPLILPRSTRSFTA